MIIKIQTEDTDDPLIHYQPLTRLYCTEDISFVRGFMLANGGDPGPTIRALRQSRWQVGLQYVGDLVRDLHRQHRQCGQKLADAGLWIRYYQRWLLMLGAYVCLGRLMWVGFRFRFGLGETDREAVLSIVARALNVSRALAALQ